jgi:hypothetical protein
MNEDELEYVEQYPANYIREILKEYHVTVPRGAKKPLLVSKLKACMRLQAALTSRRQTVRQ